MKHDRNLAAERYERLYRDAMIRLAIKEKRMKLNKDGVAVPAWTERFAKAWDKPLQSEPGSKIWDQVLRLLARQKEPMIRSKIKDHTNVNSDTIQRTLDRMVSDGLVEVHISNLGRREVRKYALAK